MSSAELWKRWRVTIAVLKRACSALPQQVGPEYATKQKEFDEFIEHNELGLAMGVLAEIAESAPCRGGSWRDMERAAIFMELTEHAERFRARFLAARTEQRAGSV